jgi:hypothetical protein
LRSTEPPLFPIENQRNQTRAIGSSSIRPIFFS